MTPYPTPEQDAQLARLDAIHQAMRLETVARMQRHDESKRTRHMIDGPCVSCESGPCFHENRSDYR